MPLDLTPEITRRILTKRGFNPDEYDINSENGNIIPRVKESPVIQAQPTTPSVVTTPTTPPPPTPLGSGLRKFAEGLLPSGAGIGAGIAAAGASMPLAAVPLVGPVLPPLIGLGAGIGASIGASKLQDIIMPESIKATLAADVATNPLSSIGGQIASGLPFMSPSPSSVIKAGGTLKNILMNPLRAGAAATPAEIGNLANVAVGGGVGTGMSIAGDISNNQPIDWQNALIQGGANALLNNPTKLSQRLFKATPNVELSRSSEGARAKELANVIKLNPESPTLAQDYKNQVRAKFVEENPNSLDTRIYKAKTEAEKFDIAETDIRPPRYVSAKDSTTGEYTTDTKEVAKLAKKHLPSLVDEKGRPVEGLTEDYIRERLDQKLHGKNFESYKMALEESNVLSKKMADEAEAKAKEKAEKISQSVDTYKLDTRRFGDYNAEQKLTDVANATKLKTLQEEAIKAGKKPPKELSQLETLQNPVAKPVTTTADKAKIKEANYQAYKNAQAKGDFQTAADYAESGFLERFQAENSGAEFKPFEAVSNLGLKKIPGTKEHPKQTVPASKYGPQRRTLFQEIKAPKYPSADILEQQAEATGKKPELTKVVYDYLAKTFGPLRGVDFKLDASITDNKGRPVRGFVDIIREGIKKSVARINPTTATPDTVGHEGLHKFIDDLETNGSKQDKQIVAKIYKDIEASPEYANFNQQRIASGRGETNPNEFLTETTGYDVVRRLFNTDNNTGTFRQSWKDLLTAVKIKWGGASREDYNKFLGRRFIEDPSYTEVFGGATTTGAAANNISDEEVVSNTQTQQQESKDNTYGNIPNNERQSTAPTIKSDATKNTNPENKGDKSAEVLKPTLSDYDQYQEVQKKFKAAILAGKELSDPEMQALWKENEVIKNRNGGMPSAKPATLLQEALEDTKGEVTKPRPTFEFSAGKVLRDLSVNGGIKYNKDISAEILVNTLRNKIPPAEFDMLKSAGLEEWAKGKITTPEKLDKWLAENGPRVETHSYGMEGKVSEAKKEYDKMTHEWYDQQPLEMQEYLKKQKATYNAYTTNPGLRPEYKTAEYIQKANDYIQLKTKVENEPANAGGPRATSAYSTVSALDTTQPMPEWTATRSSKNVQRVDVVIPTKQGKTGAQYLKEGHSPEEAQRLANKSYVEDLWQPDNIHENLPNTLGWAMIQYKTGPKGEKIAVIVEAQSRWGQSRREANQLLKSKEQALREKEIVQLHKGTLNRNNGLTNVVLGQDRQTVVKVPDEVAAKLQVGGKMTNEAIQIAMKHYEEIGTRVKDAPDHPLLLGIYVQLVRRVLFVV